MTGMTPKARRFIRLALVLLVAAVFFYLAIAGPVLFSYEERYSLAPQPVWSLLNPLRSRAPERPAEALLRDLVAGNTRQALGRLPTDPPISQDTMENEQRLRLITWRLVGRQDLNDRVELLYHCARVDHPDDARRPLRIRVARSTPAAPWQVIAFSAIY